MIAAAGGVDRWVEGLRPAKRPVDPWAPIEVVEEDERTPRGTIERVLTVFLAGRECPFRCVYCDLWRQTLDGPTPAGAVPRQIERALATLDLKRPRPERLKLYNASNYFDRWAVPRRDDGRVAELAAGFGGVTVECHPRLVGRRCLELGERLEGRLEVAMGLETVHPEALRRLNKRMTVDDFDRAARRLLEAGLDLRAFVLVGVPFLGVAEQVRWAVRSVEHALAVGARHVALIPVRPGNGALEALAARGAWVRPPLALLEEALERTIGMGPGVVTADAWDLARMTDCPACLPARVERIVAANRSGTLGPAPRCTACGAAP